MMRMAKDSFLSARLIAGLLIFTFVFSSIPPGVSAQPTSNESDTVDLLYKAQRDPDVVDTFKTLDATLEEHVDELVQKAAVRIGAQVVEPSEEGRNQGAEVELVGEADLLNDTGSSEEEAEASDAMIPQTVFSTFVEDLFVSKGFRPATLHVLNDESHPEVGDIWTVRFTTDGVSDVFISPVDEATREDDEFLGLYCDGEKVQAETDDDGNIWVDNWNCEGIGEVKHMTLKKNRHTLRFAFGETLTYAYNGPNTHRTLGTFVPNVTGTFAGDATANHRQPDPRAGDLMLAVLFIRPSANTISTPAGWTSLGSWTGTDGGAEGIDTGSVRLYWFYKVATGSEGVANVAFAETGTTSVHGGKVFHLRSASGTYDLQVAGKSINGDTTTWGGTGGLDANLEIAAGDSVFLAAAQNGNLSNTSAWNITATGINSWSTVREVFEYTSTTGNDGELGLAYAQARSGTSAVAQPTLTITQSAAASGAVSVLRVRQGPGANRTDTWIRSDGAHAAGSTSVVPAYPAEQEVGDLLILLVGNRNSTVSPSTPANWTLLNTYTGTLGTFGADAGGARISAYYRQLTNASGLLNGTQSVTVTSGNTSVGKIYAVHRDGASSWTIDIDGGNDQSAGTAWSVTGSGLDFSPDDGGDEVLVASSINTDAYTYSAHALSASGITFAEVNEQFEVRSATGNDMTLETASASVTAGSGSVAPTYTMTSSGSGASAPAGATAVMTIRATGAPFIGRKTMLISNRIELSEGARFKLLSQ